MKHTAAGLVLYKTDPARILIVRQTDGTFSIPKGRTEPGERAFETAQREVEEEIGVHVPFPLFEASSRCARVAVWSVDGSSLPEELPPQWLQAEEVVWAGFVDLTRALRLLPLWQHDGVLELVRDLA